MKHVIKTALLALVLTTPAIFAAGAAAGSSAEPLAQRGNAKSRRAARRKMAQIKQTAAPTGLFNSIPAVVVQHGIAGFLGGKDQALLILTTKGTTQEQAEKLRTLRETFYRNNAANRAIAREFAIERKIFNVLNWASEHKFLLFFAAALGLSKYWHSAMQKP